MATPMARYTSIMTILSLATVMKWKIHQKDVKTSFLNGVVEEEVYVEQPLAFETHDRKTHVCKLKKALYGLKHAPRTWYGRIDSFLNSLGFTKSNVKKEGIDYEENFAPVAKYTSIISVLALAVVMKWKLHRMDVKKTLLNGVVEEEVYVEQPLGFDT